MTPTGCAMNKHSSIYLELDLASIPFSWLYVLGHADESLSLFFLSKMRVT